MAQAEGIYVPFEDAEKPLVDCGLKHPHLIVQDGRPHDDMERIRRELEVGDISKFIKNGWIFFQFPGSRDDASVRGNMQVWTGSTRNPDRNYAHTRTVEGSFSPGLIDEEKVCIRITNRLLKVNRNNLYDPHDPNLPALKLLQKGIDWIIQKADEYALTPGPLESEAKGRA